jgi:hypothetical protein
MRMRESSRIMRESSHRDLKIWTWRGNCELHCSRFPKRHKQRQNQWPQDSCMREDRCWRKAEERGETMMDWNKKASSYMFTLIPNAWLCNLFISKHSLTLHVRSPKLDPNSDVVALVCSHAAVDYCHGSVVENSAVTFPCWQTPGEPFWIF